MYQEIKVSPDSDLSGHEEVELGHGEVKQPEDRDRDGGGQRFRAFRKHFADLGSILLKSFSAEKLYQKLQLSIYLSIMNNNIDTQRYFKDK
jgi:hypothetical protein